MKDLRSSRRLVKMRQRRDKATIDRLVPVVVEARAAAVTTLSAYTPSGLAIAAQVRKTWSPSAGGLAIF